MLYMPRWEANGAPGQTWGVNEFNRRLGFLTVLPAWEHPRVLSLPSSTRTTCVLLCLKTEEKSNCSSQGLSSAYIWSQEKFDLVLARKELNMEKVRRVWTQPTLLFTHVQVLCLFLGHTMSHLFVPRHWEHRGSPQWWFTDWPIPKVSTSPCTKQKCSFYLIRQHCKRAVGGQG